MASTFLYSRPISTASSVSLGCSSRFLSPDSVNLVVARSSHLDVYSLCPPSSSLAPSSSPAHSRYLLHSFSVSLFGNIESMISIRLPGRTTDSLVVAYSEAKLAVLHFDPSINDLVTLDTAYFEDLKERITPMQGIATPPRLVIDPLNRCFAFLCYSTYLVVFPLNSLPSVPASESYPISSGSNGALLRHFAVNLSAIDLGGAAAVANPLAVAQPTNPIQSVKDLQFLHGYSDPALMLLSESRFSWEGRYAVAKHTVHLQTLSFNLNTSSWTLANMSPIQIEQNAFKILPIPEPNTGAFILATNLIYHFNNSSVDFALSTNEHGEKDEKLPFHLEKSSCICALDNATGVLFGPECFVLSNRAGELLLLKFQSQGSAVRYMKLDKLGPSVPAHTIVHYPSSSTGLHGNYLALLSSRAPSLLFHYGERDSDEVEAIREADRKKNSEEEAEDARRRAVSGDAGEAAEDGNPSKRQRTEEIQFAQSLVQQPSGDELFDEIYGASTAAEREADRARQRLKERKDREAYNYDLRFTIVDLLHSLSPVADFDVAHQFKQVEESQAELLESDRTEEEERKELKEAQEKEHAANELQERSEDQRKKDQDALKMKIIQQQEREEARDRARRTRVLEIVSASGSDDNSLLVAANEGVVPTAILSQPLDKRSYGVWTVKAFEPAAKKRARERKSAKRRLSQGLESDSGAAELFHSFLLIATVAGTELLKTGVEVAETTTEECHLLSNCRTIAAANMLGERAIVQAHRSGIRFILLNDRIKDYSLASLIDEDRLHIVRAYVEDPYILLHLSDSSIRMIHITEHLTDLDSESPGELEVKCSEPRLNTAEIIDSPITAACLYSFQDRAGLFAAPSGDHGPHSFSTPSRSSAPAPTPSAAPAPAAAPMDEMDDLERLLAGGGDVETAAKEQIAKESMTNQEADQEVTKKERPASEADFLQVAVIARCAMLEIYRLPDFELLFRCDDILSGARILSHASPARSDDAMNDDDSEPRTPTHSSFPGTPRSPRSPSSVASASSLNRSFSGGASSADLLHYVSELSLTSLGPAHSHPALFAFLSTGDLLIYQSFRFSNRECRYPIRFHRFAHSLIFRSPLSWQPPKYIPFPHFPHSSRLAQSRDPWFFGPRFQSFENVSGRSALFIGGFKPCMAFAERGLIRLHEFNLVDWENQTEEKPEERPDELDEYEQQIAGETLDLIRRSEASEAIKKKVRAGVSSVTAFHNVNCDHGFIYVDTAGFLHICELPPVPPLPVHKAGTQFLRPFQPELATVYNRAIDYDSELALRLVPLFARVHLIARHSTTGCYVLIVSRPVRLPSLELETERSLPIYEDKYELLLYSGKKFEIIGRFDDFEAHESVLSIACIKINGISYIAIGTTNQQGEDVTCKGRIILLEAYYAMGFTVNEGSVRLLKLRAFAQKEKGPVTCVGEICGLVMAAVGNKVLLYQYDGKTTTARAFVDVQLYVVSAVVIKNYILLIDVCKNVQFALWDPIVKQLTLLGRANEWTEATACEALIDGKSLNLLAADADLNVQLFRYQPQKSASPDPVFQTSHTQRLTTKADFHVGEFITKMRKIKMRVKGGGGSAMESSRSGNIPAPLPLQYPKSAGQRLMQLARAGPLKSIVLASTRTGNFYSFSPLDELLFRRLSSLYAQMCHFVPQTSALHPKGFRSFRTKSFLHANNKKNVLDAQLLLQYLSLDTRAQQQLAKLIGTYPEQIIDNLLQLQWALSMH